MKAFIKIHPSDMVAVALKPLSAGETLDVDGQAVTLTEDIPQGHKFALQDLSRGDSIVKYGEEIGVATEDIPKGAHVHVHNVISRSLLENETLRVPKAPRL